MSKQHLHIRNARLIDPQNGIDERLDLFVADGRIAAIGQPPTGFSPARQIDASGLIACPAWSILPPGWGVLSPNSRRRSPVA
jgi:dihydroorotase-like cyclic amidohydrolase